MGTEPGDTAVGATHEIRCSAQSSKASSSRSVGETLLVSTVNAKSRSGTNRHPEFWPGHSPPCSTTRMPSAVRRRNQVTPTPSSSNSSVPPGPGSERIAARAGAPMARYRYHASFPATVTRAPTPVGTAAGTPSQISCQVFAEANTWQLICDNPLGWLELHEGPLGRHVVEHRNHRHVDFQVV